MREETKWIQTCEKGKPGERFHWDARARLDIDQFTATL